MDAVVIVIAILLTVVTGRRLLLHGWLRRRMGTDRAALLWALTLPAAILAYSAARQQLQPVLLLIAAMVALSQFTFMRWAQGIRRRLPEGTAARRRSACGNITRSRWGCRRIRAGGRESM